MFRKKNWKSKKIEKFSKNQNFRKVKKIEKFSKNQNFRKVKKTRISKSLEKNQNFQKKIIKVSTEVHQFRTKFFGKRAKKVYWNFQILNNLMFKISEKNFLEKN